MKNRLFFAAFSCSLAMALATPAIGAQYYDIEIIVFANNAKATGHEHWPRQVLAPNLDKAVELSIETQYNGTGQAIKLLNSTQLRLGNKADALRRSAEYTVLFHGGWRQPGVEEEQTSAIRIKAMPFEQPVLQRLAQAWSLQSPQQQTTAINNESIANVRELMPDIMTDEDAQTFPVDDAQTDMAPAREIKYLTHALDGTISVVRSRYLHVYTNLIYTLPYAEVAHAVETAPNFDNSTEVLSLPVHEATPMQSFVFQQHRRMRSKELHYMDHPLLGMVVLATPVGE